MPRHQEPTTTMCHITRDGGSGGRSPAGWGLGARPPENLAKQEKARALCEHEPSILCSPDGIRTRATALRGRRPRPLDDGARTDLSRFRDDQPCDLQRFNLVIVGSSVSLADRSSATKSPDAEQLSVANREKNNILQLGYQDSNLEWLNQNQLCCQLHHTPMTRTLDPTVWVTVRPCSERGEDYQTPPGKLQIAWSKPCFLPNYTVVAQFRAARRRSSVTSRPSSSSDS